MCVSRYSDLNIQHQQRDFKINFLICGWLFLVDGCKSTDKVMVTVHKLVFLADDDVLLDRHGTSEGNIHTNHGIVIKKGPICANKIRVDRGAVFLPHETSNTLPTRQDTPDLEGLDAEEEGVAAAVTNYELTGNYPNPFNPSTTIEFAIPQAGKVSLKIFTATGQLVNTLVDGEMAAGRHAVRWNSRNQSGTPVASGFYFYQLVVQKQDGRAPFSEARSMTLLK